MFDCVCGRGDMIDCGYLSSLERVPQLKATRHRSTSHSNFDASGEPLTTNT